MFDNWRGTLARKRFYRLTRDILDTPPMPVQDGPLTIISMVSKNDIQMYLLALKSFYYHLRRGKVVAIVDADTPAESKETLRKHLPGIRFEILENINTGQCQRGGTWERILYVLDHAAKEYAIQLDCDTLTVGNVDEVLAYAERNIPFTLGNQGLPIWTLPETSADAKKLLATKNYVGIVAESRFDEYPNAASLKYVRGSSGFAGFAKGGFSRSGIEDFHQQMSALMGERWREWGTEQNASNFAVANSPGAVVLPYPKYTNYTPDKDWASSSFFHFFGTYRYTSDYFLKRAVAVIERLNAEQHAAP